MDLRAFETGGVSLARQLVKSDLKAGEPCGRPGCVLDTVSGGKEDPTTSPLFSTKERVTCVERLS